MQVQDVGAEKDAITSLCPPTHFRRSNWDKEFTSLVDKHRETGMVWYVHMPTFSALPLRSIRVLPQLLTLALGIKKMHCNTYPLAGFDYTQIT
ncbi:hypothetical protein V8E55_006835 [Tylopilus felleus]